MKNINKRFKTYWQIALVWIVSIVALFWILQWNVFQNINNLFFDPITTTKSRGDIVVIGIDEKSLARFGAWPWDRDAYAHLLGQLKIYAPRAIGFDIIFAEPRAGDDAMREALQDITIPTVFASKIEQGTYINSLFATTPPYISEAVVNVFPDEDAKVRSIQNNFLIQDKCVPSFSQQLTQVSLRRATIPIYECDTSPQLFRYQESVKKVSFADIVDGLVPRDEIKDKIVLIGFATTDLEQDSFFGLFGTRINGVEIHTSALAHHLDNVTLQKSPIHITLFISLLLAILLGKVPFFVRKFSTQLIILVSVILLTIIGTIIAYEQGFKSYIPWLVIIPLFSYLFTLIYSHIANLHKNEYLKKLFGTYVHPSLLEQLIQNPKKLVLGGEKRCMTVLFSDVRGFTSFSEKLSPEELVDLLNDYLDTMSPLILDRKGTIDKYIGDAIMAFWNAPVETPHHELLAVETALIMQEKLAEFNTSLNRTDGLKLGIGIGVNTGEMVVGNMGSKERFNYTVMGDAVNTGSRFEGLTKKYGVITIVGEATRNAIVDNIGDESILFRKLDIMTVKGKSDPTTIYEPLRATPATRQFIATYEAGFDAYTRGDFVQAKSKLEPLARDGDGPSQMLLERMETIDPATWKGVWKWEEK